MVTDSGKAPPAERWSRIALAAVLLLPFALFWGNWLPGQLVMTSDQHLVNMINQHEQLRRGWGAHWVNLWWLGLPSTPPMVNVENFLVWLLPPIVYAKLSLPFYLALGGLCAYVFGRAVGFSRGVAVFFALAWEINGSSLTDIPGGHHFRQFMLGVLPLMFLGLWWASQRRSFGGVVLAAAVVGAMMGGLPDAAAILAMSGVAFFIALNASRLLTGKFWAQAAVGTVVTLALCIQFFISYLPGWTSGLRAKDVTVDVKESAEEKWGQHAQWSFSPEELFESIAPGFFGWSSGDPAAPYWGRVGQSPEWRTQHAGFRNFRIDNPTAGTGVAALAAIGIFGAWRRRRPEGDSDSLRFLARFFSLAGLAALLMSFGRHVVFYRWIYDLGFFSSWRNPNKFYFVAGFAAAFLAGYGAQLLRQEVFEKSKSRAQAPVGWLKGFSLAYFAMAIALAASAWFVWLFLPDLKEHFQQKAWSEAEAAAIALTLAAALLRAGMAWGIWGGLLKWAGSRQLPRRRVFWACWSALTALEMAYVAAHYIHFFKIEQILRPHPLLEAAIDDPNKPFRIRTLVNDSVLNQLYFFQYPHYHLELYGIPASSRIPDDYAYYFQQMRTAPIRELELANVKYLLAEKQVSEQFVSATGAANRFEIVRDVAINQSEDGFSFVNVPANDPKAYFRLSHLKTSLPRVYAVGASRAFDKPEELFQTLKDPKFEPLSAVLVFRSAKVPDFRARPKKLSAKLIRYEDNHIEIEASSDAPAYVVIGDKFDGGWRATINGAAAGIFRANFIFRGVPIPAGESKILLDYVVDDSSVRYTVEAWVVVALIGAGFWIKSLRQRAPASAA
ncbi:MAG: hypothetical protein JO317_07035 [Verrucomicrobiae bacterium]|nr:hypothetical protein [Verrucomicrobiae bacterium]